jgi:hypothetical protein
VAEQWLINPLLVHLYDKFSKQIDTWLEIRVGMENVEK